MLTRKPVAIALAGALLIALTALSGTPWKRIEFKLDHVGNSGGSNGRPNTLFLRFSAHYRGASWPGRGKACAFWLSSKYTKAQARVAGQWVEVDSVYHDYDEEQLLDVVGVPRDADLCRVEFAYCRRPLMWKLYDAARWCGVGGYFKQLVDRMAPQVWTLPKPSQTVFEVEVPEHQAPVDPLEVTYEHNHSAAANSAIAGVAQIRAPGRGVAGRDRSAV